MLIQKQNTAALNSFAVQVWFSLVLSYLYWLTPCQQIRAVGGGITIVAPEVTFQDYLKVISRLGYKS